MIIEIILTLSKSSNQPLESDPTACGIASMLHHREMQQLSKR